MEAGLNYSISPRCGGFISPGPRTCAPNNTLATSPSSPEWREEIVWEPTTGAETMLNGAGLTCACDLFESHTCTPDLFLEELCSQPLCLDPMLLLEVSHPLVRAT